MSENNTVEQLSPSGENAHHLVELEHVEKYYGNLHVLRDINLKVDKGEVLVIAHRRARASRRCAAPSTDWRP